MQEQNVLTIIIEIYGIRNNKNVTLRNTTFVIANMKATTCFDHAKLYVRKYKRRIHRIHILIELTVGISPILKLYMSVTSGKRFTRRYI